MRCRYEVTTASIHTYLVLVWNLAKTPCQEANQIGIANSKEWRLSDLEFLRPDETIMENMIHQSDWLNH